MILRELVRAVSIAALFGGSSLAQLPDLDITDEKSIKDVAAKLAFNTMSFYNENQTGQIPGKLPGTWWEGGFLFNMLIQYWWYTGDTSYNPTTTQGLLWQAGEDYDYMPSNYSAYLTAPLTLLPGNDDQVFWGLAAMTAAELNYPEIPNQPVSWLALAQGVFNTQAERWDTDTCNGGLHWQINFAQPGYTLKNSVSNGGFFMLGARLALFTGNASYADQAIKVWNWSAGVSLIDQSKWHIADSVSTPDNCSSTGDLQWTYNYGIYLTGAAYMYNFTNGSALWGNRVTGLLDTTLKNFLKNGILAEPACDINMKCNRDQNCFKGLVSHWLALTTYLFPSTASTIVPVLQASAPGAVKQCSGTSAATDFPPVNNGQLCGLRWWSTTWDGTYGIEQSASVLSIVTVQLLGKTGGPPKNTKTGGTSKPDPGAAGGRGQGNQKPLKPITTADRAGAAILTLIVLVALIGGGGWLLWND